MTIDQVEYRVAKLYKVTLQSILGNNFIKKIKRQLHTGPQKDNEYQRELHIKSI